MSRSERVSLAVGWPKSGLGNIFTIKSTRTILNSAGISATDDLCGAIKSAFENLLKDSCGVQGYMDWRRSGASTQKTLNEISGPVKKLIKILSKDEARKALLMRLNLAAPDTGKAFPNLRRKKFRPCSLDFAFSVSIIDRITSMLEVMDEALRYEGSTIVQVDDKSEKVPGDDFVFDSLVDGLCIIWEKDLGQKIGTSTKDTIPQAYGPLVNFISSYCDTIGVSKQGNAVRDAVIKRSKK